MARFRKYALSDYPGTRLSISELKRKAERQKLIGKRIGFDLASSCMSHIGTVTGSIGREIEIDGNLYSLDEFQQISLLHDQESSA